MPEFRQFSAAAKNQLIAVFLMMEKMSARDGAECPKTSVFRNFLTIKIMQIALTGLVLRPIPRFNLLTGKQLAKERSDETHLPAKRNSTQTSSWFPLSDVYRGRSPSVAGTSFKGSCAPFCLTAVMPVEGCLNGV